MATLVGKVVALLLTQVFQKSSQNTTTVRKIPQWVNGSTSPFLDLGRERAVHSPVLKCPNAMCICLQQQSSKYYEGIVKSRRVTC